MWLLRDPGCVDHGESQGGHGLPPPSQQGWERVAPTLESAVPGVTTHATHHPHSTTQGTQDSPEPALPCLPCRAHWLHPTPWHQLAQPAGAWISTAVSPWAWAKRDSEML